MSRTQFFTPDHRLTLSQALKAVRRLRRMTASETAVAMAMPLRSYEYFEAGRGRFDFEKVRRFAEVMEADPFGILAAVQIGSPRFAARVADSKLMMALMLQVEAVDRRHADALDQFRAAEVMAEIGEAFRRLEQRTFRPPGPS